MINLLEILNQFVTLFRKKLKFKRFISQALLRFKINRGISDTPCI
jgi:hypothetical protein